MGELKVSEMSVRERIMRISQEVGTVNKQGRNDYGGYDYIRPDDLEAALKPLYLKYELFVHFFIRPKSEGRNEAVLRVSDWNDEKKQEVYTMWASDISLKGANAAQSMGGLMTYCKKYLLMNAFHISSSELDPDSGNKHSDVAESSAKKTSAKKESKPKTDDTRIALNKLCQEKAKIDKEALMEILKSFSDTGKLSEVADKDIPKLTEEINKIQ